MKPLLATIPHSGERIPEEVNWLKGLAEAHLMCDVDRFVDQLYLPTLEVLGVPHVVAEWHRYVVDLNRFADDVDAQSVEGSAHPPGSYTTGLHWVKTTTGLPLMHKPITRELHETLVKKYFDPFHKKVKEIYASLHGQGFKSVYHLDLHSMPSVGTATHRDPGQKRAEIVISDCNGKSSKAEFKDLVIKSFDASGFQVAYNWPYMGGRLTEHYGQVGLEHHAIQIELRRDLYMDETTKRLKDDLGELRDRLGAAITRIHQQI